MSERVLMLNAAFIPLGAISWMRAICLLLQGRAEPVVGGGKVVRSPSQTFVLPAVMRLLDNAMFPKRRVRLTKRHVHARDGYTCQYCGDKLPGSKLNLDHVIPRAQGGETRWSNIVTSCHGCNNRKGPRTPQQAGMKLLRDPKAPGWGADQEISAVYANIPEAWLPFLRKK